jgi:[glutamine synthetase] adenylyltransferase / [glutamine synthetase]-adenylyl-L-tyrosine phosphorylase
MDTLRRFKQVQTLRLLAQDVAGRLTLERCPTTCRAGRHAARRNPARCWAGLKNAPSRHPRFAVIGYGKLGGKELGYASDLDIVFLYDDADERAQEIYARLAQRINTWLTTLTPAGMLYETDLRLRPDGASGLLVSDRGLPRLPAAPRLDLGTPGADARPLRLRRRRRSARPSRPSAARCCAPRATRRSCAAKCWRCARRCAPATSTPAVCSTSSTTAAASSTSSSACSTWCCALPRPPRPDRQHRQHRPAAACRRTGLIARPVALPAADAYRELRRMQHAVKLSGAEYARVPHLDTDGFPEAVRALWAEVMGGHSVHGDGAAKLA